MIQVKNLYAEGPFVIERRPPFDEEKYVLSGGEPRLFGSAAEAERFLHDAMSRTDLTTKTWTIMPAAQMPPTVELPPPCPTCGAPAVAMSQAKMTTLPAGMGEQTVRPHPAGPTIECADGHYYVVRDGEAIETGGPPEDITIREGWR